MDPVDSVQNSVRLILTVKNKVFKQLLGNWGPISGSNHKKPEKNQCFGLEPYEKHEKHIFWAKKMFLLVIRWSKKRFFGNPLVKKTIF